MVERNSWLTLMKVKKSLTKQMNMLIVCGRTWNTIAHHIYWHYTNMALSHLKKIAKKSNGTIQTMDEADSEEDLDQRILDYATMILSFVYIYHWLCLSLLDHTLWRGR